MHLEGEGIFPWGPGHVSLPYLVSEGTVHTLLLAGDEDGYEKRDHEYSLAFPIHHVHTHVACLCVI